MKRGVLLALLMMFGTASCMKKPDLRDEDGQAVSADAIEEAVISGWGGADLLSIAQDEFAYTVQEIGIANMPPRVRLQDAKQVPVVTDGTDNVREYTIVQQLTVIDDNNQGKPTTSQRQVRIQRDTASVASVKAARSSVRALMSGDVHSLSEDEKPLPLSFEMTVGISQVCRKAAGWNVDCYNLRVWDSVESVPAPLAARENCAGLPNCQWRKRNVAFDLVATTVDAGGQAEDRSKILYHLQFSPDAPVLSRLTDYCYQGLAAVQNSKVPVSICQRVQDFIRGTPRP